MNSIFDAPKAELAEDIDSSNRLLIQFLVIVSLVTLVFEGYPALYLEGAIRKVVAVLLPFSFQC